MPDKDKISELLTADSYSEIIHYLDQIHKQHFYLPKAARLDEKDSEDLIHGHNIIVDIIEKLDELQKLQEKQ